MDKRECSIAGCHYEVRAKSMCDAHYRRDRNGLPVNVPILRATRGMSLPDRMVHYTDRRGANECWPWLRGHDKDGYGEVSTGGSSKHRRAHIVAWELANDKQVPKGMCVMHSCDNPPCVNPAHLKLGTNVDNIRDRCEKGRTANQHGSTHGMSKLTEEQVLDMRRMWARGAKGTKIAAEYGVTAATVSNIVNRKTWTHI